MSDLRARLVSGPPLLLDGGLGSMLLAEGLPAGSAPECWNVDVDRAELIVAVHTAYVEAGSEAIHTNTFGANTIRLASFGLAQRCAELNRAAVALARRAKPKFVLGDVGPTGEYLAPVGKAQVRAWRDAFEIQGRALADAGVDGFHIETMGDVREACVALEALRAVAPSLPVLVSLTFDRKRRGFFTVMGDSLAIALVELVKRGADAVGANCSIVSTEMLQLAEQAAAVAGGVPLVLQANAGQPRVTDAGDIRYDHSPEAYADDVAGMVRLGVRLVGGCCGTRPQTIAAVRAKLAEVT